ncbi:rna-directed dna polymerase from mobile element jockey-like [Willisornis vidua]|uniref:Rna-directed dna polymerase from mobile element jockey-like n=1 Tax=Willisornis vidua TaxID=1566151 RepID=A0ABQ9DDM7_9PASS|nr:rna-directed dna polymerase from mobile element jockey-like [Willisornis vidua]
MYTNACSMGNKKKELQATGQQESYDVVAITEMWWDESHDWSAAMGRYKVFRKDRQSRRGEGVALHVRESLVSVELEVTNNKVECLWTRTRGKANKADILVGVYYRPPSEDDEGDELFYKQLVDVSTSPALVLCPKRQAGDEAWLNREILKEIKEQKGDYQLWKKGLATHEEFRNIVRVCRKKIRETKVQFEINLATSVRDNKKHFHKYINNKRRGKENLHSLFNLRRNIVNLDEEKAEVLNFYFASVFTSKTGQLVDKDRKMNSTPKFQEDTISDLLQHLDPQKSRGPDGIHHSVMRELAEELAMTLSIIYQQSWVSEKVLNDWKLVNVTPIHKKDCKEDLGNHRSVSVPRLWSRSS